VTREVYAPKGRYSGSHKVYCTVYREWNKLCQNRPGPMRRCYIELADNPFPSLQANRHHQLRGKLKGFWEYEVDSGARVRYKRGPDDRVIVLVVYAGPAPSDTH
jgi:mRNA-degrading endonuclease YafQ of YafQ-DinJ toxin-antitoxin module